MLSLKLLGNTQVKLVSAVVFLIAAVGLEPALAQSPLPRPPNAHGKQKLSEQIAADGLNFGPEQRESSIQQALGQTLALAA